MICDQAVLEREPNPADLASKEDDRLVEIDVPVRWLLHLSVDLSLGQILLPTVDDGLPPLDGESCVGLSLASLRSSPRSYCLPGPNLLDHRQPVHEHGPADEIGIRLEGHRLLAIAGVG